MLLENEFPVDDRVEKEALSLMENGFNVSILCPTFNNQKERETFNGIDVHRFSISKSFFNKLLGLIQLFPFYKNLWKKKAFRIIEKQNINIVHIHDLPLCCLIDPIRKIWQLKIVADMHENYPAMVSGQEHMKRFPNKYVISIKKWYKLEKRWLVNADLIICTASGMIDRLKKEIGEGNNFVLVPNTVDIEKFNKSQKRNSEIESRFVEDFLILSYGVVSEQRGVQYAIGAIDLIKDKIPEVKLLILGDGSYLEELKSQALRLGIEKYIIFEGWQKQSFLISYMKNTDLCIIPHIKSEHTDNTSPNKLFHFMYFKKAVIASNCNYIQEIVEDENCGLIYRYDSVEELAEAIEVLYNDKGQREKMEKNGVEAISLKYNWSTTASSMIQKYKSLEN